MARFNQLASSIFPIRIAENHERMDDDRVKIRCSPSRAGLTAKSFRATAETF